MTTRFDEHTRAARSEHFLLVPGLPAERGVSRINYGALRASVLTLDSGLAQDDPVAFMRDRHLQPVQAHLDHLMLAYLRGHPAGGPAELDRWPTPYHLVEVSDTTSALATHWLDGLGRDLAWVKASTECTPLARALERIRDAVGAIRMMVESAAGGVDTTSPIA